MPFTFDPVLTYLCHPEFKNSIKFGLRLSIGKLNHSVCWEEEKINGFWSHKGATGWGDAIVIIPWTLYKHYGNIEVLRDCYESMIKWCDYLWSISQGPIIRNPRYPTLSEGIKKRGFTFDIVRPSLGEELPNNLKLVAVPDSGHALLPEQHEIVQKVILEWLRERN